MENAKNGVRKILHMEEQSNWQMKRKQHCLGDINTYTTNMESFN